MVVSLVGFLHVALGQPEPYLTNIAFLASWIVLPLSLISLASANLSANKSLKRKMMIIGVLLCLAWIGTVGIAYIGDKNNYYVQSHPADKKYTNTRYGFSLIYPSTFGVQEQGNTINFQLKENRYADGPLLNVDNIAILIEDKPYSQDNILESQLAKGKYSPHGDHLQKIRKGSHYELQYIFTGVEPNPCGAEAYAFPNSDKTKIINIEIDGQCTDNNVAEYRMWVDKIINSFNYTQAISK